NRHITDPAEARRFLQSPLSGLHEPELLPGMADAVERIIRAIRQKKKVGVYDVDGVTGTAILLVCLKHLGADVDFHVPHRLEEGYGLNSDAIRKLAAS